MKEFLENFAERGILTKEADILKSTGEVHTSSASENLDDRVKRAMSVTFGSASEKWQEEHEHRFFDLKKALAKMLGAAVPEEWANAVDGIARTVRDRWKTINDVRNSGDGPEFLKVLNAERELFRKAIKKMAYQCQATENGNKRVLRRDSEWIFLRKPVPGEHLPVRLGGYVCDYNAVWPDADDQKEVYNS